MGHDAVFDVPLELAREATGFRPDRRNAPRFSELVVVGEYGNGRTAPWRHAEQSRSHEALPRDRETMSSVLMMALGALLQARGFVREVAVGVPDEFTRTENGQQIRFFTCAWENRQLPQPSFTCDLFLGVRNDDVNQLMASIHASSDETIHLSLSKLHSVKTFPLASQADLATFIELLETEVPRLIEACSPIPGLERLVNGDRDSVPAAAHRWTPAACLRWPADRRLRRARDAPCQLRPASR